MAHHRHQELRNALQCMVLLDSAAGMEVQRVGHRLLSARAMVVDLPMVLLLVLEQKFQLARQKTMMQIVMEQ